MVQSGLTENTTVSHFRLAIHLNLALILFSSLSWYKNNIYKIFVFLIFLQITFGAFVSGLDAGQLYQTWPLMNESYFPDDVNLKKITVKTIFYDRSLIQFLHRNLAYFILLYGFIIMIYIYIKKLNELYIPFTIVFLFLGLQILLGIVTLISGLNIVFASIHQVSTIFLLSSSIYLCHKSIN